MIAILYPLKMDNNLSEAYSAIYKEGTKYGLTKGTGKPGGAMKDYLDKKAKKLQKEYDNQSKEKKNNPAFQSNKLNPQPQYNSRYRKEWEALKLMEQEEYTQDFNEWKSGLVEEGYDISRWSESELVETFINEHDLWKSKDAIMKAISESDKKGSGSGKKDACYKKVKASASVWPSAYASGRLVQCRKKGAANYGNSKSEGFSDWRDDLGLLDEDQKMSDKFYDIAKKKGEKRRSSYEYRKKGERRGVEKNERAAYNLSQASVSRNKSLETQSGSQTGGGSKPFGYASDKKNPVKSKSVGDTGAEGHRKKRDEKVTTKKDGKTPLKTPRYKLSMGKRVDHHSSRRQELKDPKKNPKHEANKK